MSAFNVKFMQHDRELIQKLAASAFHSSNAEADSRSDAQKAADATLAENALAKLIEILKKYRFDFRDLQSLLAEWKAEDEKSRADKARREQYAKAARSNKPKSGPDALTLAHKLIMDYVDMEPHEYVGIALWALHTHVYERFQYTPRLSLTSSTPQCGKSNTIKTLKLLCHDSYATSGMTVSAFFHKLNEHGTLIIDEADNFEIFTDPRKRGIINSGYERAASKRDIKGESFDVFTPLVVAGIGRFPAPLMERSVHVHLYRSTKNFPVLDPDEDAVRKKFDLAATLIEQWAANVALDIRPDIPASIYGRPANKWAPLISIADSFGEEWGGRARDAAVTFGNNEAGEVIQTLLIQDCQDIYENRGSEDRIKSTDLHLDLMEMDSRFPWTAYRGPNNDENKISHPLKIGDMAHLLALFNIRPKKIRFKDGGPLQGYEFADFKRHWAAYPRKPGRTGTPEHANTNTKLKLVDGGKKK